MMQDRPYLKTVGSRIKELKHTVMIVEQQLSGIVGDKDKKEDTALCRMLIANARDPGNSRVAEHQISLLYLLARHSTALH